MPETTLLVLINGVAVHRIEPVPNRSGWPTEPVARLIAERLSRNTEMSVEIVTENGDTVDWVYS